MQRLAAVCHSNTRFAADPHIDPDRRAELYCYWVARDVTEAPLALVAKCRGGGVCGYVTGSIERATGTINLIGVDPASRSAGVGGALLDSALAWCADHGVDEVRLVTQGANVLAQRLFQSRGFRTSSVGLWFHKWYETR
jgi:ribosomal protein S18 acetylase RimI-like enzyme